MAPAAGPVARPDGGDGGVVAPRVSGPVAGPPGPSVGAFSVSRPDDPPCSAATPPAKSCAVPAGVVSNSHRRGPRGSYLATHFLLVVWVCSQDHVTVERLATEFLLPYDRARHFMLKLEQLRIVRRTGRMDESGWKGGRNPDRFVPVRRMMPEQT